MVQVPFSFVYEPRHTSVGLLGSNAFFFFSDRNFFFKADKFFDSLISPVQGGEILPTSRR